MIAEILHLPSCLGSCDFLLLFVLLLLTEGVLVRSNSFSKSGKSIFGSESGEKAVRIKVNFAARIELGHEIDQ